MSANILPEPAVGVYVVLTCDRDVVTYRLDGAKVQYMGKGDLHDTQYDELVVETLFDMEETVELGEVGHDSHDGHEHHDHKGHGQHMEMEFEMRIYPSTELQSKFQTNKPIFFTAVVVAIFALTSLMFLVYDLLVQRRQKRVLTSALRSNAIVSSLFPEQVKERLMDEGRSTSVVKKGAASAFKNGQFLPPESAPTNISSRPIADLFPNASCL